MSNMITFAFVTFILAIIYVYHLVKLVENVASSQVDRAPIDGDMCEVEKARVLELRHQSGDRKKLDYYRSQILLLSPSERAGELEEGEEQQRKGAAAKPSHGFCKIFVIMMIIVRCSEPCCKGISSISWSYGSK